MRHRVTKTVATGSLALLLPAAAAAMPIRGNTPGTGVFIGSGVVTQVVCEERRGGGAEVSGCAVVADFRYTPATHWVLGARAPLVLDRRAELDRSELSGSGLGDLELAAKWRFFRQVGPWFDRHAAVELRVKLPTGDSALPGELLLPRPLAHRATPGTGSTDWTLDLVFQQARRRFVWSSDLLYRRNGLGEAGYRFGDELRLNLNAEYILLPRVYTTPGRELFVLVEPAIVYRRDDRLGAERVATGGTEALIAPGLQYVATEQMLLSVSLQLPLWDDLSSPLKARWNALAEIRWAF
jgi:hypothetical protein